LSAGIERTLEESGRLEQYRRLMRSRRTITVVGCHAGGEIGNVIVGGVLPPAGDSVFEQMQALQKEGDWLRRLLLREPRGSVACHANLVVPATRPDCDAGFIIMEPTEYPAMSGSNTICTATVLLETGMLEMREPETVVRLEAPGGVVEARAACRDGRCESVEFTNVPCFTDRLDATLEVEGLGTMTVDVAFGGMWYAIADASALGFAIEPHEARDLSLAGERIRAAAREQLPCTHPENPAISGVSIVQLAEPWQGVGEVTRNAVVVAPGRLDRSATGTGLSARMAVLHARGLMRVGDAMTHASALGSTFDGRIVAETRVGDRSAIVPAIRGSAWITGIWQVFVDPSDPFPGGYLLSDTWGVSGLDTQQ
jgi:trans-L-3-hydroxyproline dehydratase